MNQVQISAEKPEQILLAQTANARADAPIAAVKKVRCSSISIASFVLPFGLALASGAHAQQITQSVVVQQAVSREAAVGLAVEVAVAGWC